MRKLLGLSIAALALGMAGAVSAASHHDMMRGGENMRHDAMCQPQSQPQQQAQAAYAPQSSYYGESRHYGHHGGAYYRDVNGMNCCDMSGYGMMQGAMNCCDMSGYGMMPGGMNCGHMQGYGMQYGMNCCDMRGMRGHGMRHHHHGMMPHHHAGMTHHRHDARGSLNLNTPEMQKLMRHPAFRDDYAEYVRLADQVFARKKVMQAVTDKSRKIKEVRDAALEYSALRRELLQVRYALIDKIYAFRANPAAFLSAHQPKAPKPQKAAAQDASAQNAATPVTLPDLSGERPVGTVEKSDAANP